MKGDRKKRSLGKGKWADRRGEMGKGKEGRY